MSKPRQVRKHDINSGQKTATRNNKHLYADMYRTRKGEDLWSRVGLESGPRWSCRFKKAFIHVQ